MSVVGERRGGRGGGATVSVVGEWRGGMGGATVSVVGERRGGMGGGGRLCL